MKYVEIGFSYNDYTFYNLIQTYVARLNVADSTGFHETDFRSIDFHSNSYFAPLSYYWNLEKFLNAHANVFRGDDGQAVFVLCVLVHVNASRVHLCASSFALLWPSSEPERFPVPNN